ncbi:hypothetical protein WICPIJ_003567 [Wickerhamomyces pijperi]|uniref:RNA polymerase II elongation factor ELL N-terminal domain-containing protein n=1 Tax=Wickerhamomyces pijperi TaxID=599730 RepID=A0A9P8Q9E0_WICPI|nr:hypothetical protein WICPIJ_003567 [Wickerhamomyces pijperi]
MSTQKVFPSKPTKLATGKEITHIISQISISPEVQALLKENQNNIQNIKIVVKNGEISLKITNPETNDQYLVRYDTTAAKTTAGTAKVHVFKQFSSTILKDLGPVSVSSAQSGAICKTNSRTVEPATVSQQATGTGNAFTSRIKIVDSPPFSKSPTPIHSKPSTPLHNKPISASTSASAHSPATIASSASYQSQSQQPKSKLKPQQIKRLKIFLALGPHSLKDLSGRLKASTPEVANVIDSVGQTFNPNRQFPKLRYLRAAKQTIEELYVLKYPLYQDLRLSEFPASLSAEDMKIVRRTFEVVYNDVLKLDQKDPARAQLRLTRPASPLSNPPSSAGSAAGSTASPYSHHRTGSNGHSRVPSSSSTSSTAVNETSRKRKATSSATGKDTDTEYFVDLAERFKTKYKEYESLYRSLNNSNNSSSEIQQADSNLQKLFEMHKTLESWKSQLWKSVENA